MAGHQVHPDDFREFVDRKRLDLVDAMGGHVIDALVANPIEAWETLPDSHRTILADLYLG
jgi:hypothetical protein